MTRDTRSSSTSQPAAAAPADRRTTAAVGYARDEDPTFQVDALRDAGAVRVFVDVASGATATGPQLTAALDYLRPGDVLTVWRLDRLGRSLRDLIDQVKTIDAAVVGFRSLTESIDTTSAGGGLIFHVFGALAEFERQLIVDRTRALADPRDAHSIG